MHGRRVEFPRRPFIRFFHQWTKKKPLVFAENLCETRQLDYASVQRERSPLMISGLILRSREPSPYEKCDLARAAPWSVLSWGVFLPVVFVGNVALAIVAWYAV